MGIQIDFDNYLTKNKLTASHYQQPVNELDLITQSTEEPNMINLLNLMQLLQRRFGQAQSPIALMISFGDNHRLIIGIGPRGPRAAQRQRNQNNIEQRGRQQGQRLTNFDFLINNQRGLQLPRMPRVPRFPGLVANNRLATSSNNQRANSLNPFRNSGQQLNRIQQQQGAQMQNNSPRHDLNEIFINSLNHEQIQRSNQPLFYQRQNQRIIRDQIQQRQNSFMNQTRDINLNDSIFQNSRGNMNKNLRKNQQLRYDSSNKKFRQDRTLEDSFKINNQGFSNRNKHQIQQQKEDVSCWSSFKRFLKGLFVRNE